MLRRWLLRPLVALMTALVLTATVTAAIWLALPVQTLNASDLTAATNPFPSAGFSGGGTTWNLAAEAVPSIPQVSVGGNAYYAFTDDSNRGGLTRRTIETTTTGFTVTTETLAGPAQPTQAEDLVLVIAVSPA
ncbi:hypothetical protein [Lacticaseibacillus kribbianus]|uniref:hypothetical protein n=1 Tax=Lacticaseibacillus kribbianus TaxID=2926292 RepID=UPI001CD817B4|nr:hypothetical protein [Lacticaseibacillus kribbianus]